MDIKKCALKVCEAGRKGIEEFRDQLENAGLTWSGPDLIVREHSPRNFTAELKVEFLYNDDLVDIFEFHVCRGGDLIISENETRTWIRENIPDVLYRQTHRVR